MFWGQVINYLTILATFQFESICGQGNKNCSICICGQLEKTAPPRNFPLFRSFTDDGDAYVCDM